MLETYRYNAGKFPVSFFVFELTGLDVGDFLQNQSTYNFSELKKNEFHLTSFLDSNGKIDFYTWALKLADSVLLLTPEKIKDIAHTRLEKFLISEDVTVNPVGVQSWTVVLGPNALSFKNTESFVGSIFEEDAILTQTQIDCATLAPNEIELWRGLNGWPDFSGEKFAPELINNMRLYDLSVSPNKGCYPGQETVSKIATRRGAAYSPVLLETEKPQLTGAITSFEKKIGDIEATYQWENKNYSAARLLRDFRVAGMKVTFNQGTIESEAIVRYYPLLPGKSSEKAQELYYEATDAFKIDDLALAEKYMRLAIELDPTLADAYEGLGVMLGRQERFAEAIELMDHLTQVDASSVLAHTNKSLYLMKLGKIEEAEEQKSLATIKSFQKFGSEAKLKEQVAAEKKAQEAEWSKREDMFKQVLEIDDEDTLANYGLGSIAVERGEWDKAIAHLEKVLKADVNYSVAYLALGKAYKGNKQTEKANATFKEGIAIAAKKGDLMPANQMQFELQNL